MSSTHDPIPIDHHDWHSAGYVDQWIARDLTRDDERRIRLRRMLAVAARPADAEFAVLDVGGGYGVVTEEVLRAFPHAQVTLQDYSQPMLDRARARLTEHGAKVRYALGDLRDPAWARAVGGPFDLVVSAIAIHNLRDSSQIAACYRAIAGLVKPDGVFLDYDLFELIGGLDAQLSTIRDAGFATAECVWQEGRVAIVAARPRS
ncbi:MAG TPA: class I SAM-dependent methyltransferase [Stellaceae bacterium]|nr:class I SAM-dependent methyltransferase [Stellaceae bacterium]